MKEGIPFVMALLASVAFAATEVVDGIEWTYEIHDGQAAVGCWGRVAKTEDEEEDDWDEDDETTAVAAVSPDTLGSVSIPTRLGNCPVVRIGPSAFANRSGVSEITIPETVCAIRSGAFAGCNGLTDIRLPLNVSIGTGAFRNCSKLASVTMPTNAGSISAFVGCNALRTMIFPLAECMPSASTESYTALMNICRQITHVEILGGTDIGREAFNSYYWKSLEAVEIPSTVTNIGHYAFRGCSSLKSLTLPEQLKGMGIAAFANCSELRSVVIPHGLVTIAERAFSGCTNLQSVVISPGVKSIGKGAFSGCSGLEEVEIPSSVTAIRKDAFSGCEALGPGVVVCDGWVLTVNPGYSDAVTVPSGAQWLSVGVFADHPDIVSVTLPPGLTALADETFSGCTGLKSVTIPSSVTWIGRSAFSDCGSLESVTLPPGLTEIGSRTFENCVKLKSVTIPPVVTEIGYGAFAGCSNLKDVTIPASVESIGSGAFARCGFGTGIVVRDGWAIAFNGTCPKSLKIPTGVRRIANGVFGCQEKLQGVTLPEGVVSIGCFAFEGCERLSAISLPKSLKHIEDCAFDSCCRLKSMAFPSGLEWIGDSAFSGCEKLASVTLPANLTHIGESAFSECEKAFEGAVTIPAYVTEIGIWAFSGCGLTNIFVEKDNKYFTSRDGVLFNKDETEIVAFPTARTGKYVVPSSVRVVGAGAFSGCNGLTSVKLPDGVVSLGDRAFQNCGKLKTITIPSSVRTIGAYAFASCNGFKRVNIPFGACRVSEQAFDNCAALESIVIPSSVRWYSDVIYNTPCILCETGSGIRPFSGCCSLKSVRITGGRPEWLDDLDCSGASYECQVECHSTYRVRFDANEGDVMESERAVDQDGAIGTLPTPTRAFYAFKGWYTARNGGARISATTAVTDDVTYYARWQCDGKVSVNASVCSDCASGGTISGGNARYVPGEKVTLKATPSAGCLFLGWFADEACTKLLSTQTKYSWKIKKASDVNAFARFEKKTDLLPKITCATVCVFTPGVSLADFPVSALSSYPGDVTLTVTGVPSGLKYKNESVYGTPRACGKTVIATVTAKNEAGTTTKKVAFVPSNPGFVVSAKASIGGGDLVPVAAKDKVRTYVGVPFELTLSSKPVKSGHSDYAANSVSVSGLKNGLSFNEKTGTISGIATKTGKQTVKAAFKNKWGWTATFTFYIHPQALPAWIVGDYNGTGAYGSSDGTSQLTVSSKGGLSGKIVAGGKSYSFKASSFTSCVEEEGGAEIFTAKAKVNDKYTATFTFAATDAGIGAVTARDEAEKVALEAYQDAWAREDVAVPAYKNGTVKLTAADLEALGVAVKEGDGLSVKFKAGGAVAVTGSLAGKAVSVSTKVIVTALAEDGTATGEIVMPYGKKAVALQFVWMTGKKPQGMEQSP